MTTDTISADGNWTCPAFGVVGGTVQVRVTGNGDVTASHGAPLSDGGGGGAYSQNLAVPVSAGLVYAIVGIGVTGGGLVEFRHPDTTALVTADGGVGNTGGLAANSLGTLKRDGANGGTAGAGGGGGGGGAGTATAAGAVGANGGATLGGAGGLNGDGAASGGAGGNVNLTGADGAVPGGGAGGCGVGFGGAAAVPGGGKVTITYTTVVPYDGGGQVNIVAASFVASTTLSAVIPAPAAGYAIELLGWELTCTGAAAPIAFFNDGSTKLQSRRADGSPWRSSRGSRIRLATATALDVTGGAAGGILNGQIRYRVVLA